MRSPFAYLLESWINLPSRSGYAPCSAGHVLAKRLFPVLLSVAFSVFGCEAAPDAVRQDTYGVENAENPDVQSPEEVAAANEAVRKDFGQLAKATEGDGTIPDGYSHIDPNGWVPRDLLATTLTFFDAKKSRFPNQAYVSVVDLRPRSDRYRMFVIDIASGAVERFHTTHGRGSGPMEDADGFAPGFGNVSGSKLSSIGFIRTAEVYFGTFNRSIRLDGLSTTNTNVRARAIVFHGWDYVKEANIIQNQSAGCVTLDWTVKDGVLDKIKEGSLMYIGLSSPTAAQ
jgi:hypothetical protein